MSIANEANIPTKGQCKYSTFKIKSLIMVKKKNNKVTLDHILYAPELHNSFLSVQSCTYKGYVVAYKDYICSIKQCNIIVADAKNDEIVLPNQKVYNSSEILPVC